MGAFEVATGVIDTVVDSEGERLSDTEPDTLLYGVGVKGWDVAIGEAVALMQAVEEREGEELVEAVGGFEVTTGVVEVVMEREGVTLGEAMLDTLTDSEGVTGLDVALGEMVVEAQGEDESEGEREEEGVNVKH